MTLDCIDHSQLLTAPHAAQQVKLDEYDVLTHYSHCSHEYECSETVQQRRPRAVACVPDSEDLRLVAHDSNSLTTAAWGAWTPLLAFPVACGVDPFGRMQRLKSERAACRPFIHPLAEYS